MIADQIAGVFFGDSFREQAANVMPWLAASVFIYGLKSFYLDLPFQLKRQTKYQAYISLLMAAINVLLNLLLLPKYGLLGAAWAVLIAFAVGAGASWVKGRAVMRLPWPGKDLVKSIVAVTVMMFAIGALPRTGSTFSLASTVVVGACSYAASAYLLDLWAFRAIVRRSLGVVVRKWAHR